MNFNENIESNLFERREREKNEREANGKNIHKNFLCYKEMYEQRFPFSLVCLSHKIHIACAVQKNMQ